MGTGPQEEPGVAVAPIEDDIQVAVSDGPPESPVDLKPRDKRRISLRFRRRRKESTGPKGLAATGMMALSTHNRCWRPWGGPCTQSAGL